MREIKFRGKPVDKMFGSWEHGYYLRDLDNGKVVDYIFNCPLTIRVKSETVGQFTGLHDKNGVEIYEGDILHIKSDYHSESTITVEYNEKHARFNIRSHAFLKGDKTEVIGNIHDNKELRIEN